MSAAGKVIAQCRKPSGLFGRFVLWDMNRHHSKLTDWGLSHVPIKPNDKILDVGCGAGACGPPLIAAGHSWLGLEVNPVCCAILDRRNLPYRQSKPDEKVFPVKNQEFDCAVCIEVLEHIGNPNSFLSQIARAIRQRAIFSVPNLEIIPYFASLQVVPWHLLEADHKNFFTRTSLHALLSQYFRRVEVFSYATHPVHTREGIPLHAHLFAIADK